MDNSKNFIAHFSARILWALEPFVQRNRMIGDLLSGNIFIEPAAEGGAFVGAIMQHGMAVFHAKDAHASGPLTLDIPDAAFDAARSPEAVIMNYCGEHYALDMPEWMQPETVYLYDAGMHIQPKTRAPVWADEDDEFQPCLYSRSASHGSHEIGLDYRGSIGLPGDWRKPLVKATTEPPAPIFVSMSIDPTVVALFDRAIQIFYEQDPEKHPQIFFRPTGTLEKPGPVLVTLQGRPDFAGALMPLKSENIEAPPIGWHFLKKAAR